MRPALAFASLVSLGLATLALGACPPGASCPERFAYCKGDVRHYCVSRQGSVVPDFTVEWANAQLAAGATAICYFDPVSSTTNIPRRLYLETGQQVAKRTISRIKGATATHLASGRGLDIIADIADTGTAVVGVSVLEDLRELKAAAAGRVSLLGNLNGIEMRRWSPAEAELQVKRAIARAGRGGGFILGDNHGEIPWQVPDETLLAIREAVERWGRYPLDWIDDWTDPGLA